MNDKRLQWALKLQSIAQTGLAYCKDEFDVERYMQIRDISAEMLSETLSVSKEKLNDVFLNENGYQTPKIDTRAAIFSDGKILMVREKNGKWSLPGGWCDVDCSIAQNVVKESREETGLCVSTKRIIAVQDWRKHNVCNYVYGVIKVFVLCEPLGGEFVENIETDCAAYFAKTELPKNIAAEKNTEEQIFMCFNSYESGSERVLFD